LPRKKEFWELGRKRNRRKSNVLGARNLAIIKRIVRILRFVTSAKKKGIWWPNAMSFITRLESSKCLDLWCKDMVSIALRFLVGMRSRRLQLLFRCYREMLLRKDQGGTQEPNYLSLGLADQAGGRKGVCSCFP
jgi:hypothetical protein